MQFGSITYFKALAIFCVLFGWVVATSLAVAAETPTEVEQTVRVHFADTPVMIEIARCESKFRQFTDAGNPLRGGYGSNMIGVFQFFESVHTDAATKQGHDLATLEGNMAYAKYVYDQSGVIPWNSSRNCWETNLDTVANTLSGVVAAQTPVSRNEAELRERIALLQQLVLLLQTLLTMQLA